MKFGGHACLIYLALVLVPLSDAAKFMTPQHASLVRKAIAVHKEIPTVKHDKDPGQGYNKGSPLYEKQQKLSKQGKLSVADTAPAAPTKPADPAAAATDAYYSEIRSMTLSMKGFIQFLVYVVFTLCLGFIWSKQRSIEGLQPMPMPSGTGGFTWSFFSFDHAFNSHGTICFCSWCCAPLRMADTYAKQPLPLIGTTSPANFWTALICISCLIGLGGFTCGLSTVIVLFVGIYMRRKLRKQYGLSTGGRTWIEDIFAWWCCPCCAMVQEARQVEFVAKPNVPYK